MNELIFFAVIIFFTIIEAIAKARKKREEGGEEQGREVSDRERLARRSGPRDREEESSETMIPEDIWEEISGLGRSRQAERERAEPSGWEPAPPPQPAPPPKPAPSPMGRDRKPVTASSLKRTPATTGVHRMHKLHPELGTDPSGRKRSEQDWRPEVRENRNAKRVRAMLRGSEGTDALKQAFILKEVLGPPAAMKED